MNEGKIDRAKQIYNQQGAATLIYELQNYIKRRISDTYFYYKCAVSHKEKVSDDLYIEILNNFPDKLGLAYDAKHIKSRTKKHYWPSIYGMVASAEASRALAVGSEEAFRRATKSAEWLYQNKDINNNGIVGWGSPVPWDAGGNGVINKPHTEFSNPTTIAVAGLLDVVKLCEHYPEKSHNVPTDKYIETAKQALSPYVDCCHNSYAEGRCFWYATQETENYDVLNTSAKIAGQIQRLNNYTDTSQKYKQSASEAINYILEKRNVGPGNRHWPYYGTKIPAQTRQNPINDLLHHAYIVDGVYTYFRNKQEDLRPTTHNEIKQSFQDFIDTPFNRWKNGSVILEKPNRKAPARIWGYGYMLYVLAKFFPNEYENDIARIPYKINKLKQTENPTWAGYGSQRHNAHLLYGMSKFLYD